jgi:hypothetical protein
VLSLLSGSPLRDVDLSVNTDFEDLFAFLGDNIEFAEQDKSFLLDAVLDFTSFSGLELAGVLGFELILLRKLLQSPVAASLAKNLGL